MAFRNFATGQSHAFGGDYLELTPHARIRYTNRFDDPNLPGVIGVTVTLTPVSCGTGLHIEQSGLPAVIPAEACDLGRQESLALPSQLVEATVPA